MRPHVRKDFRDKLGPAERWLASQVGRPWDKVYAELRARFDIRTTAGRHVVFDHLLDWVWRGAPVWSDWARERWFVVDAHGILRRGRFYGRSYRAARAEVERWRAGRRIARIGTAWWWMQLRRDGRWTRDRALTPKQQRYFERLGTDLQQYALLGGRPRVQ